jgi:hypothetical protein
VIAIFTLQYVITFSHKGQVLCSSQSFPIDFQLVCEGFIPEPTIK